MPPLPLLFQDLTFIRRIDHNVGVGCPLEFAAIPHHLWVCQYFTGHTTFTSLTAIGIDKSTVPVSYEASVNVAANSRHSAISILRRLPLQSPTSCTIIKACTRPMSAIFLLFSSNCKVSAQPRATGKCGNG